MSILRSTLAVSLNRLYDSKILLHSSARTFWFGKYKDVRLPTDYDHSTGEERLLRTAIAKGNTDPFDLQEQVRGPGTKDDPNIIQTFTQSRIVGCKCEEESSHIKFMWVHVGEPKRCHCGYWFKAVPAQKFWEDK